MRPVNLMPPEQRRGERTALRAGSLAYGILGALVLALLGIVGMVLAGNQITERTSERSALEVRGQAADQQIQQFAAYGNFASLSQARQATVTSLAQSRFDWERVLNELARIIPDDVWLEDLTGKVSAGVTLEASSTGSSSSTATTDSSITGPSLQIAGCADGQEAVARFVAALKDIDGVTRVGLQKSSLGDSSSGTGTSSSASTGTTAGGCQTRNFIAVFDITVAFDAVPAPPTAVASTTTPAATPATGTTTTPTTATTTTADDGGVAAIKAEQQSATASAAKQSSDARKGAAAVGMGG